MGRRDVTKRTQNVPSQSGELRIAVIGEPGVGKSCLIVRYVQDIWVEDYDPTMEDSFRKAITCSNGEKLKLDILDTAGEERYALLCNQYIEASDAFIVAFGLTHDTDEECQSFVERIYTIKNSQTVPIIIVGTKLDLFNDDLETNLEAKYAKAQRIPFFPTSAKENTNVIEPFARLADLALGINSPIPTKNARNGSNVIGNETINYCSIKDLI
jgi:GTPase KRas